MRYTHRQLEVFLRVTEHSSVTRAAESLMTAQPAVSAQLRALERAVGVRLFDRVGRTVVLNQAGMEFRVEAERMLAGIAELKAHAEDLHSLRRGTVTVAASTTAGNYVAPRFLGSFRRSFPGVSVRLHVSNRLAVQQMLLARKVDLAVMGAVDEDGHFEVAPFLSNSLIVVAPPGHALVRAHSIPLSALSREEFLVREPGSGTRVDTEEVFGQAGLRRRVSLELGSTGAIKEAVMAGLGLAILPQQSLELELAAGELAILNVEGFPLERQWKVVWLRRRTLSPAAHALRSHLLALHQSASFESCDAHASAN